MNIWRDFIEANFSYNIVDVLDEFEGIFDALGVDISTENLEIYNADKLAVQLKLLLLNKAQENGIIPFYIDIENCFEVNNTLAIRKKSVDSITLDKIVKDFKYYDIDLDII